MTDLPLPSVLGGLLGPGQPEVTCDTCFEELDRYVELEMTGSDPETAVPGMRAHLHGCPACAEEHHSLTDLLHNDQADGPLPTDNAQAPTGRVPAPDSRGSTA